MMRWLVGSSMQFRILVVSCAAVLMLIGVVQLRNAPVDVLPEFDPPYVEVQTEALGLSASEVEQLITVPLEADLLNGVAFLKTIRSESIPGLSSVVLVFEPGTDLMKARQVVQERLTQAHALPNVSSPPAMLQPLSSTARILNVGLTSQGLSPIEMSVLARWTIKPRLMGVPGVAHVSIWGQRKRQLQVQVDPEELHAKGVTLHQVIETAGDALWISPLTFLNASYPGTGGFIDTPNQRLGIRHVLPITTPEELAKVAVSGHKNMVLGEIATVVENHQPLIGDALVGEGSGLLLVVEKFPWANTLGVTQGVEEALASLAPGLGDMKIDTRIFRPATYIEAATNNLSKAWMIGLALGALALVLLVMEWRSVLISLVAIPMSLTAAALVLYLREGSLNAMLLAGLMVALGVIVDDANADVRNIVKRLRKRRDEGGQGSVAREILEGSLEMRSSLAFATAILLLISIPAFVLYGVAGAMMQPIALSYVLAVFASLLVALTVTPALSVFFFSKGAPSKESPVLGGLSGVFGGIAAQGVRKPAGAIVAILVLIGAGAAVLPTLDRDHVVPTFKETDILVSAEGAPGTSLPAMRRVVASACADLRSIPGVRNVGAHVGRAVMSEEVANVNSAEIWVSVDPYGNYEETIAAITSVIESYPGLDREVLTYSNEAVQEAMYGSDDDIVVRVYGENQKTLHEEAAKVRNAIASIDGIVNPEVDVPSVEPVVQVEADMESCERHGIKPGDIRRATAVLLGGIEVGMLFEDQKVFDVVVWSKPSARSSLTDVRELLINTPAGGHVRLEDVARVRVAPAPTMIKREGVNRHMDVTASVSGRERNKVAADVDKKVKTLSFPLEFHAALLDDSGERDRADQLAWELAIACAIGVLLVLHAAFGSWRLSAMAFLALPMALSGGLLAVRLTGGSLTLGSLLGLLAVFGIAVRGTIAMIHQYQRALQDGESFGPELIHKVTSERLGSVLTTVIVTGLLVLPLAFTGSIAGQEVLHPMAVVILGGLVTTTLLLVYGVPALYARFGRGAAPEWNPEEYEKEESPQLQYAAD